MDSSKSLLSMNENRQNLSHKRLASLQVRHVNLIRPRLPLPQYHLPKAASSGNEFGEDFSPADAATTADLSQHDAEIKQQAIKVYFILELLNISKLQCLSGTTAHQTEQSPLQPQVSTLSE